MRKQIGVKVFTATVPQHRNNLGEVVTAWLEENPDLRITNYRVLQSSDYGFHCVTIYLEWEKK
jgi:hypothetical protein